MNQQFQQLLQSILTGGQQSPQQMPGLGDLATSLGQDWDWMKKDIASRSPASARQAHQNNQATIVGLEAPDPNRSPAMDLLHNIGGGLMRTWDLPNQFGMGVEDFFRPKAETAALNQQGAPPPPPQGNPAAIAAALWGGQQPGAMGDLSTMMSAPDRSFNLGQTPQLPMPPTQAPAEMPDFSAIRALIDQAAPQQQAAPTHADRLTSWLAGMGKGMLGGNGIADALLGAGAGGLEGTMSIDERTRQEQQQFGQEQRKFALGKAESELGLIDSARKVRQANNETDYQNATARYNTTVANLQASQPKFHSVAGGIITYEMTGPDGQRKIMMSDTGESLRKAQLAIQLAQIKKGLGGGATVNLGSKYAELRPSKDPASQATYLVAKLGESSPAALSMAIPESVIAAAQKYAQKGSNDRLSPAAMGDASLAQREQKTMLYSFLGSWVLDQAAQGNSGPLQALSHLGIDDADIADDGEPEEE